MNNVTNQCTECGEDAKHDEWSDYDNRVCINCGTNESEETMNQY